MQSDQLKITVLEDGTIKVETDEVGQANHLSADKFLEAMSRLAGGDTETIRKGRTHAHHHHGQGQAHSH